MDGSGTLYYAFLQAWSGRSAVKIIRYPPDQALSYAELTEIAERSLPPTGSIVLLGESFSGPISITLAARHPQRVIAVVLCCSFCRSPHPQLRYLPLSLLPMLKTPATWIARWVLARFSRPELSAQIGNALKPLSAAALRSRLRGVLTLDVRDTLSQLTVPMLYLQSNSDRLVPNAAAMEICAHAPQTRIERIDGAHFLLQTSPVAAAQAIGRFLDC